MGRRLSVMVSIFRFSIFGGLGAFLILSSAVAQERVFEPVAPENLDFNFPKSPRESDADFFPIAKNGEERCVIVIPPSPERSFRAAAAEFVKYLALATGAKFRLVEEGQLCTERARGNTYRGNENRTDSRSGIASARIRRRKISQREWFPGENARCPNAGDSRLGRPDDSARPGRFFETLRRHPSVLAQRIAGDFEPYPEAGKSFDSRCGMARLAVFRKFSDVDAAIRLTAVSEFSPRIETTSVQRGLRRVAATESLG